MAGKNERCARTFPSDWLAQRPACLGMALSGGGCLANKAFFAFVGLGFALMKVSVYSTIGLVTNGEKEHASLTSHLEGVFMMGMLTGYWLFGYFIARTWTDVYWVLSALTTLAFLLLLFSPLDERAARLPDPDFRRDFLAPIYPTLCSTILSRLPKSRHSAMTSLVVIFSALGRRVPARESACASRGRRSAVALGLRLSLHFAQV